MEASRRPWLSTGGIAFVAACAAAASVGHPLLGLAFVGLGGFAALFVVPLNWLPVAALWLVLFVPVEALPVPQLIAAAPLAAVPLLVWLVRVPAGPIPGRLVAVSAGLTLAWTVLAAALSTYHHLYAVLAATPLLLIAAGVLRSASLPDPRTLRSPMITAVALLALAAVAEKYVFHANPIYGPLYESAPFPLTQGWSTYRATTTIGHPLVNGTIFAAVLVLAVDDLLTRRARTLWALLRILMLLGGLAAVVSRGSVIAAAVGVALLLILRSGNRAHVPRVAAVSVVLIGGAVLISSAVLARSGTVEGQTSLNARSSLYDDTVAALRGREFFGVGPGMAEQHRVDHRLAGVYQLLGTRSASYKGERRTSLENAYAEIVVGVGLPGLVFFVVMLLAAIAQGLARVPSIGSASALAAVTIALAGYNAIDAHKQLSVFILLLLILLVSEQRAPDSARGALESAGSHRGSGAPRSENGTIPHGRRVGRPPRGKPASSQHRDLAGTTKGEAC
jgi:O-antigen ligase